MEIQIVVHDIGEIDPRIGDVPICGSERESDSGIRKKILEPVIAQRMFRMVPNNDTREIVSKAYLRYIRAHPKDPESQFVHFVDKMQGTTRGGLNGIFSKYSDFGFTTPPSSLEKHLEETLPKMIAPALNLARVLSREGRCELNILMEEELQRLEEAGYEALAQGARIVYKSLILHPY